MKILHCCLANFYIDNYGYQENVLPKMHKMQGHDVSIVASTETYLQNSKIGYISPSEYENEDGIPVQRLPYSRLFPAALARKLRVYTGLSAALERSCPDVIFIHDCQFLSISEIARYAKSKPKLTIFVDSHTDLINSGRSWISMNILHRIIYRYCAKLIEPHTTKFFGTLPVRMDFYRDVYGIPENKLALLVMGADQSLVDLGNRSTIRQAYRQKAGLGDDDFVFVTGGKIDRLKNIHHVLAVFGKLHRKNVKLLLFGTPTPELKPVVDACNKSAGIVNLGWLSNTEVSHYLLAADCAIFPGTHSVLWEQAVGLGLACIFRKWPGMQHVDLGGNCIFLESGDEREIHDAVVNVLDSKELFDQMRRTAISRGVVEFSYYEIAKRAIGVG